LDCSGFKRIFEPESIAVIGMSSEGFGIGRGILMSLLNIGYSGQLFPVNPRRGIINGLPIYESVEVCYLKNLLSR
jgi:acyl-CoA synthetase (NDP forming)